MHPYLAQRLAEEQIADRLRSTPAAHHLAPTTARSGDTVTSWLAAWFRPAAPAGPVCCIA